MQLADYLAQCKGRAFDWASWNCCHFAGGWVKRITGVDALAGLPGTPSRLAALRVSRRLGATLADAVSLRLGFEQTTRPRLGDLVMVEAGALGICTGTQAVALLERGLAFVPMPARPAAWRVSA